MTIKTSVLRATRFVLRVLCLTTGLHGTIAATEPPATFSVADSQLGSPVSLIAYGDMRFTDPANTSATNPKIRRWLVHQIALQAPDTVLVTGDIPLSGSVRNDYNVFEAETAVWRDVHLRIFPALGNHELRGDPHKGLENWWDAFPELRGRRWYSVRLGSRVSVIVLDSDQPLLLGTPQGRWLQQQLRLFSSSVDFLFFNLHHPPVADVQEFWNAGHNPRKNEIALQELLSQAARHSRARFIVTAGHIHNYERRMRDGVLYLVCGGGGATPFPVERTAGDLYKGPSFPNYHYVKFTLEQDRVHGTMFRVTDPNADAPHFAAEDNFDVDVNPKMDPQ